MSAMHSDYLVVRADASTRMGTGHVMRCLALAQAWRDGGGRAVFIVAPEATTLAARLKSEDIQTVHLTVQPGSDTDAAQTADTARHLQASWVVVDGYHFSADYHRRLKDAGLQLLVIDDDGHARQYCADIVLNQNPHAHEALYGNRARDTRLLLGPRYALLRREFGPWRGWQRAIPQVARKILVTLGGSDPDNVTGKVIQALQQVTIDGLEAIVVLGGSNPHQKQFPSALQEAHHHIRWASHVTNMPQLMAWADMAVSSAGCTAWELAYMGLPACVVTLAANQHPIADWLETAGLAHALGWHHHLSAADVAHAVTVLGASAQRRGEIARRGRELVDGEGSDRTYMHMTGAQLRLRQAREDDCQRLWEWANDPSVRAVSFSPEPIPWEQHVEWLKGRLHNPHCLLFIAVNSDDVPIGQVRYDLEKDEATVSITLDRRFRGQGYGSALIRLSAQKVFHTTATTVLHAYVKRGNGASVCAFEKAGYKNLGPVLIAAQSAVHLVLERHCASRR